MQIRVCWLLILLSACASQPPCKGLTHNCNNGDAPACYELGMAVFGTLSKNNQEPEKTKEKASEWFKKGCDLGHDKSCTEFSNYKGYLKNGKKQK